jgi:hypothetical protein
MKECPKGFKEVFCRYSPQEREGLPLLRQDQVVDPNVASGSTPSKSLIESSSTLFKTAKLCASGPQHGI